jgi:hypothetical protein
MTGQDFQDRLDALVVDLQTNGKGQEVRLMFRGEGNVGNVMTLSSDPNGVVDAAQLAAVQAFIDTLKPSADSYTAELAPVSAASEAFRLAQVPHEALTEAARVARVALQDALAGDADYQAAKTALDAARADAGYIAARDSYNAGNVSENFSELTSAKGKYVV